TAPISRLRTLVRRTAMSERKIITGIFAACALLALSVIGARAGEPADLAPRLGETKREYEARISGEPASPGRSARKRKLSRRLQKPPTTKKLNTGSVPSRANAARPERRTSAAGRRCASGGVRPAFVEPLAYPLTDPLQSGILRCAPGP